MPVGEFAKESANRFFGQVWDDLIGYLKIYDFLKLKAKRATGQSKMIPSVSAFWYSILRDKLGVKNRPKFIHLRDGDVVRLKDIFITEWCPKVPGRIWTTEGLDEFHEGQKRIGRYVEFNKKIYAVLDPYGKEKVLSAGFGSIRINRRTRSPDHFMYMSLVDESNWLCDSGIPLVVSKPVYEKFLKYSERGAPWLKSIEGILHLNEDLPFEQLIPKSIGAKLSPEAEATLRYRPSLPRCYLHVVSTLSLKFTYNDSHPKATAWTLFETRLRWERYRYTYTNFDPSHPESIDEAVSFINWYMHEYDGKKAITDFDGMVPRLDCEIPLTKNPLKANRSKVKKLLEDCDGWVKSVSRRYY